MIASASSPRPQDVVIVKLDAVTYQLEMGRESRGQYQQWYRVFGEGMRLAAAHHVDLWIREGSEDVLLRHARSRPAAIAG